MKYDIYEVGGRVRDKFLGLESKDVDYTVVIHDIDNYEDPYDAFVEQIVSEGYDVYLNKKSCFTARARFPESHKFAGLTADFVIARKELGYNPLSRIPETCYGTLEDDLIRRDFTVNALAEDIDGNIVDLFNGLQDLKDGILRTPTDVAISFNQDPLRLLRAYRFAITKQLTFSDRILEYISVFPVERMKIVSDERIRNELIKMFKYSTPMTLGYLNHLREANGTLYDYIISIDKLWLKPTFERKSVKE